MSDSGIEERQTICCGIHARYNGKDARWFGTISFTTMIVAYIGMTGSSIAYLGLSFDIGSFLGFDSFVLSESMIMIPILLLVSMLFFAGGIEWYVLCRHCPCYEYSGKEHGNEKRFYCLANWASPKVFKYDATPVNTAGRVVFLVWGIGIAFLFPFLYLWDRIEWLLAYFLVTVAFLTTLRHWSCSSCPNFGCVLNCVTKEQREKFMKLLETGEIYGNS